MISTAIGKQETLPFFLTSAGASQCYHSPTGGDAMRVSVQDQPVGPVGSDRHRGRLRIIDKVGGDVPEGEIPQAVATIMVNVPTDRAGRSVNVVESKHILDKERDRAES